jgi:hypothetical protein
MIDPLIAGAVSGSVRIAPSRCSDRCRPPPVWPAGVVLKFGTEAWDAAGP